MGTWQTIIDPLKGVLQSQFQNLSRIMEFSLNKYLILFKSKIKIKPVTK